MTTPQTDKPTKEALASAFTNKYQEIQAAKAILAQLEDEAGAIGDQVMKHHGRQINIVTPDQANPGKRRAYVITFQRVAKAVRFEASDVTDLVAQLNQDPAPAAAPANGASQDPAARIAAATGG